ncbi:hypothetical protein GF108_01220 [Phyllobacterium sp. SYP-B3895]|uniref:hypothetical protein n=1 Tax=Phyllobacterium sp. SYP-B3895 TaxID=2663240 RepID=UPI0012995FA7|nr:hypothetical protein [Phyllobacterium sp. SYP-B3895]MRG54203.1 hypothetical protein [Phyllobacterium sp. SYP-B3895]
MTPEQLSEYQALLSTRYNSLTTLIDELDVAASDVESDDHKSDALAEAIFLRAFTAYEIDLEKLFLHYVTGGMSLQGAQANSYLKITDEASARKLIKAGFKFLSWAKPDTIRDTALNYIEHGWPVVDMLATRTQDLSDCERVRNRIAHNSPEAISQFSMVQRNLLTTERLFHLSPGQLLRMRHRKHRKLHIAHYIAVMNEMLEAIIDPPA